MIKYIIFIYLCLFVQIFICVMLKFRDYLKGTDRIGNIHKYDMKFESPVLLSALLSTISLLLLNPHFSPFSDLSFASTSTNASTSASISLLPLSLLAFLHLHHYPLPPLRDHLRAVFQKANTRKAIAPTQFNPMSTRGHCIMMVSN